MKWVVVQVKSQKEAEAIKNLKESGFNGYCPQISLRKGTKMETIPMFRGYIFVEIEPSDMPFWRTISSHRGVHRILMQSSEKPATLPDGFVEQLIETGNLVEDDTSLIEYKKGTKIKFTAGPLYGIHGIVHWSNKQRVTLLVDLLGTDTIVQSTVHIIAPV